MKNSDKTKTELTDLDIVIKNLKSMQSDYTFRQSNAYIKMEEARGNNYRLFKIAKEEYIKLSGSLDAIDSAIKLINAIKALKGKGKRK